jgi:beta-N-acetylhexosaminidase
MGFEDRIGQQMLLAFEGKQEIPEDFIRLLNLIKPAGITLFRHLNMDHPAQVRELTAKLQELALQLGIPPLLLATDQEGGQLMAVGNGTTQLPGNMALGAAGSEELARNAGMVLGREMAAVGVNLIYAPVCDVNINPLNPVIGIRSFGENPTNVARFSAAMVEGIQSVGVGACAKHFPGHGDTSGDSHHGLPILPHELARLEAVEFPPFQAAIQSGVKMIMTAHIAMPAIDGPDAPPATLSKRILGDLLRKKLGYRGLIVTDAMDMKAIQQGEGLAESAFMALSAGADLLLMTSKMEDQLRVYERLRIAISNNKDEYQPFLTSIGRVNELKDWLAGQSQPGLEVVGCDEHANIADRIAEKSITLVRDYDGLLPIQLSPDQRLAVVIPRSMDLTPADTSSYVQPVLADELRKYHSQVDEFIYPQTPSRTEIGSLKEALTGYDRIVIGTINAFSTPTQADLVREVLDLPVPCVVVALRLPYDLILLPDISTYICSYGILEPSMRALAKALFGKIQFHGHLPVSIPGIAPLGHGLIQ